MIIYNSLTVQLPKLVVDVKTYESREAEEICINTAVKVYDPELRRTKAD